MIGLAVLVAGTFLPWLQSGRAHRTSYQAGGIIRRLVDPPGPLGVLFSAWPLVAAAAGLAIALRLLRLIRVAAAVAVLTALAAGGAALAALAAPSGRYAAVVSSGPATTLLGAGLVLVAAPACVLGRGRAPGSAAGTADR